MSDKSPNPVYLRRIALLEEELDTLPLPEAVPVDTPPGTRRALEARRRSILRTLRWYTARLYPATERKVWNLQQDRVLAQTAAQ